MSNIPSLTDMLKTGMHFGHQSSRWHPKMEDFIFAERSGVHIINLEKTQKQLEEALAFVQGIVARGGKVLFVGTKRQSQNIVKEYAEACSMPYVNSRWLGGTLTNFGQIKKVIKKFTKLKDQQAKGELKKYTKKEQLLISREIKELDVKVGGIESLDKIPEAIFIVDLRSEKTALNEAKYLGLKIIAMCDTNVNPIGIHYPIASNDDAVKSIDMVTALISEAAKEGKKNAVKIFEEQKKAEAKAAAKPAAKKEDKKKEEPKKEKKVESKVEDSAK